MQRSRSRRDILSGDAVSVWDELRRKGLAFPSAPVRRLELFCAPPIALSQGFFLLSLEVL